MNIKYLPLVTFYRVVKKLSKYGKYNDSKTFEDFILKGFSGMLFVSYGLKNLRSRYLLAKKIKKIKNCIRV